MRSGLALYLAFRLQPEDQPWMSAREDRPGWMRRVGRKLATGVPAALGVFRASLRLPMTVRPEPGARVVTAGGDALGAVRGVVVALETRRPLYAIEVDGSPTLVLVAGEDLARDDRRDVLVLSGDVRSALTA